MECAICFEKFFTPKTKKEFETLYNENIKNNDYTELMKFKNLLITTKHNETHTCSIPNCKCLICKNCWIKITHKGKNVMDVTFDDMPSIYDFVICPYCRNVDWKDYMNNVFTELQQKVLGEKAFDEQFFKKCFPEFNT